MLSREQFEEAINLINVIHASDNKVFVIDS